MANRLLNLLIFAVSHNKKNREDKKIAIRLAWRDHKCRILQGAAFKRPDDHHDDI